MSPEDWDVHQREGAARQRREGFVQAFVNLIIALRRLGGASKKMQVADWHAMPKRLGKIKDWKAFK